MLNFLQFRSKVEEIKKSYFFALRRKIAFLKKYGNFISENEKKDKDRNPGRKEDCFSPPEFSEYERTDCKIAKNGV